MLASPGFCTTYISNRLVTLVEGVFWHDAIGRVISNQLHVLILTHITYMYLYIYLHSYIRTHVMFIAIPLSLSSAPIILIDTLVCIYVFWTP